MAFISKNNVAVAENALNDFPSLVLFDLMEDMIASGWRVLGSGDCVSFENQGQTSGSSGSGSGGGFDVITSGDGVQGSDVSHTEGGLNNADESPTFAGASWRRLASPEDYDGYVELLFWRSFHANQAGDRWTLYQATTDQAFNSDGDAFRAPVDFTKKNFIAIMGTRVPSAEPTGGDGEKGDVTWVPGNGGSHNHWFIGDKDEDYDFVYYNNRGADSNVDMFQLFGRVRTSPNTLPDGSDDPDPFATLKLGKTSRGTISGLQDNEADIFEVNTGITLPERMEYTDSAPSDGCLIPVSYGLGTNWAGRGTYPGNILRWDGGDANMMESLATTKDPITNSHQILFNPLIGRTGPDTQQDLIVRFIKGSIKNKILGLTTIYYESPKIENDPATGESRLNWGFLSLPWLSSQPITIESPPSA